VESKKVIPFQRDQMIKIIDVLGIPTKERWESLKLMPEYPKLMELPSEYLQAINNNLKSYYVSSMHNSRPENGFNLLSSMLYYDPSKRISADAALSHKYFGDQPKPGVNSFIYPTTRKAFFQYPERKLQDPEKKLHDPAKPKKV
jgi:cyclin-dependent kinase 8/11